jgi:uncharacterized damage-inducible protein DinB
MKPWQRLYEHVNWADAKILESLHSAGETAPAQAVKLFTHILGAEKVWLTRLNGEDTSSLPIWPEPSLELCEQLAESNKQALLVLLDKLDERLLGESIIYRDSKGTEHRTELNDVLAHVALHGMYHRGQINLLLRLDDIQPPAVDYILFARENG